MKLWLPMFLLALPAAAQDTGEELYQRFCAACHGEAAQGDGPMGAVLLGEPPDLTGLAERAGGRFPTFDVVRRIDGRDPLLAHGGEMPLWGEYFEGQDAPIKTDEGQPIMTSAPIVALVEWLRSVQEADVRSSGSAGRPQP